MRFRSPATLVASFLVAALVSSSPARAVDTPAYSQWLVTSAKATGVGGELFVTSVRIVNGGTETAKVDLFLYPRVNFDSGTNSAPGDSTTAPKASVVVPPGQTLALDDVLAAQFGKTGPNDSGALQIESDNPVSVLSQTLVANARSATGVPGTNGFAIPAQMIENAVAVGDTGFVPYLSSAPDRTAGYRSNLFLFAANTGGDTVVNVRLEKGSDGSSVGTPRDVTLGKMVQTQINDIGRVFGFTENFTNLTAILAVKTGGPVFTGASIIDNAISSQIYAPPTKVWFPNDSAFGLVIGDAYGSGGRLDIENGFPDFFFTTVIVENCPVSPGPTAQSFLLQGASYAPLTNTTWTKNADGSFSMAGQTSTASWTGTINVNVDGTVGGNFTYTRTSTSPDERCIGGSATLTFWGARVGSLSATP